MPDSPWVRRVMRAVDRYVSERERDATYSRALGDLHPGAVIAREKMAAARRNLRALLREKERERATQG